MSGSVNKVILIGRLGKDPEVTYTSGGTPRARFTLATDDSYKDKATGEQKKRTEWHTIIAWSKLAEICGEYLTKGKQIYIEGSIRSRQWEDTPGNKRTAYEIVAQRMQMLGSRADAERAESGMQERPSREPGPAASAGPSSEPSPEPEITDEDIPF
jgi:single-strand DNA-binding protein